MSSNALALFGGGNQQKGLAALKDVSKGLRQFSAEQPKKPAFADKALLRLNKTDGKWVFGQEAEEIGDAEVAINPLSFCHGYVAWVEGKPVGAEMVSIMSPAPNPDTFPDPKELAKEQGVLVKPKSTYDWDPHVSFEAQVLTGQFKGTDLTYRNGSLGGREAIGELVQIVSDQIDVDESKPVPVVTLAQTSYKHKQYGTIYKPVFRIVRFIGMDGQE